MYICRIVVEMNRVDGRILHLHPAFTYSCLNVGFFFLEQRGRKLVSSEREEKQVKPLPTPITSEGTLLQRS
jgi:hypothetical protein